MNNATTKFHSVTDSTRRGLKVRPGVIFAGLFALSGLIAAGWAIWPDLGFGSGVRVVGGDLPSGAEHHDTPFTPPKDAAERLPDEAFRSLENAQEARAALRDLAERVRSLSLSIDGLASLSDEDRAGYATRIAAVLETFLVHDEDHFLAVTELYDRTEPLSDDEREKILQSWRNGAEHFGLAPIAVEHAEVSVFRDADGARELQSDFSDMMRRGMAHPRMVTSVAGRIPWRNEVRSYETRVPVLISDGEGGRRLALIGIILARDPGTGRWRTVETRVSHEGEDVHRGLSEAALKQAAFRMPTWPPI